MVEKTLSVSENNLLLYKREPINEMYIHFIYTNLDSMIEDIISIKHEFHTNKPILKKEQILYYIEKYRKINNKKYKLSDLLLYVNNLSQDDLEKFHKMDVEQSEFINLTKPFLQVLNMFNDIEIGETFLMFHSLTSLYIVFNETPKQDKTKYVTSVSKRFIKSLKVMDQENLQNQNKTKKFRLNLNIGV